MQSTKKAIKSLIDKEQKRVLLLTINHNDELVVNGDNLSCDSLENSDVLKQALRTVLKEEPEDEDASYNFDNRLVFKEDPKTDFPKLFAKIGGRRWKGGEIAKTLSEYLKILGFGRNAAKAYGRDEDKPSWWPKKPKWNNFWCPSKSSKEECTKLIRRLLSSHSIDPETYYIDYPNEENDSSSDSSSSEESVDGVDHNNSNIDYEDEDVDVDNVPEDSLDNDEEGDEDVSDVRRARVAALIDEYSEHVVGTQDAKKKKKKSAKRKKTED